VWLLLFLDSTKDAFLKDLTGSLLKVGWHVRGKYGPLGCITTVVGAMRMLLWFPNIPQDIFPLMRDRGLVPHVSQMCVILILIVYILREVN